MTGLTIDTLGVEPTLITTTLWPWEDRLPSADDLSTAYYEGGIGGQQLAAWRDLVRDQEAMAHA